MAKGLNLINTNIRELYMIRTDGDAQIRVLYEILDDGDNIISSENYNKSFSQYAANVRAALNLALRLISREINNEAVAEDTETWGDI